jgi:hypothetical protein
MAIMETELEFGVADVVVIFVSVLVMLLLASAYVDV